MSTKETHNMTISKHDEKTVVAQTPGLKVEPNPKNLNGESPPPSKTATEGEKADFWWWEIFGVLGSALSIVGLSILLGRYNNKPEPRWSYTYTGGSNSLTGKSASVSFNSIIALFSSLSRLCLIVPLARGVAQLKWVWFAQDKRELTDFTAFDEAARGGFKSNALLLWRLKGRHLAVIGAVSMILVQGFDFFNQNLVKYPIEYRPDYNPMNLVPQIPANSNSSIARLANATDYNYRNVGVGPYYSVDYNMKGNIWAGLYAIDQNGDWGIPSYYCSTSNCTWSNYSSLGVCSRCADLSSKLTKTCVREPGLDPGNSTGCSVSLPNGFTLGGPENSRMNVMAMSTSQTPLVYTNYTSPIAIIQSITAGNTYFVTPDTQVNASECALVPCVLNYFNAFVVSSPNISASGFNGAVFVEFANMFWDNYTFSNSSSPWNGPAIDIPPNSTRHDPTHYRMSQPAFSALKSYLEALLSGFVTSNGNDTYYFQSDGNYHPVQADATDAMQAIYTPLPYGCVDVFGNTLWDWNICSITYVAMAMTTSIRDNAYTQFDFSTYAATGSTYSPTVVIEVKWLWIIPAVAIWLLGVILFLGVIWKTHQTGVRTWRENPLAVIFLGVGDKELEEVKGYGMSEDGLKKKAEQLRVRLHFTDTQAKLVEV